MRLIKAFKDEDYFGAVIEIIYPKSKYSGFRGWVGPKFINGKFRISLPPATFEETDNIHIFYVKPEDIYKWVNIIKRAE
jgi:hypothetical protein